MWLANWLSSVFNRHEMFEMKSLVLGLTMESLKRRIEDMNHAGILCPILLMIRRSMQKIATTCQWFSQEIGSPLGWQLSNVMAS